MPKHKLMKYRGIVICTVCGCICNNIPRKLAGKCSGKRERWGERCLKAFEAGELPPGFEEKGWPEEGRLNLPSSSQGLSGEEGTETLQETLLDADASSSE